MSNTTVNIQHLIKEVHIHALSTDDVQKTAHEIAVLIKEELQKIQQSAELPFAENSESNEGKSEPQL